MKKQAFTLIVIAGLLWGTSGIFVKNLSPFGFTSLQMTSVRGVIAFISLSIFALIVNKKAFKIKLSHLPVYAVIGSCLYATAALYYSSIQLTSISTAVVLMYTAPIYVTAFSALFLKEKLTLPKAGAIGLMLVGCAFVSGIVGGLKLDTMGVILGALSGVSYAIYNIVLKILLSKGDDATTVSLYGFLFMALISIPLAEPATMIPKIAQDPPLIIPLLLGLGIITFVVPYFLYNLSMRSLSAGTVSSLGVIEPMSATIYSIIFFKEIPDIFGIIGIVMVIAAVILIGIIEDKTPSEK